MSSLTRHGTFLVADPEPNLPRVLLAYGNYWHRFMDVIYCPMPSWELSSELVAELCELRIMLGERAINGSMYDAVTSVLLEMAAEMSINPRVVVDFGTGDCRLFLDIEQMFPLSFVAGCDISMRSMMAAAHRGKLFRVGGCGDLPIRTACVDLFVCSFVLHFDIDSHIVCELRRALSESGILVGNAYGGGFRPYRDRFLRSGWRLSRSAPAGFSGHVIDVWRSEPGPLPE